MKFAPPNPSTEFLHGYFPIPDFASQSVGAHRQETDAIASGRQPGLLVISGPDSLTAHPELITAEGNGYRDLSAMLAFVKIIQRLNPWKPRSNEEEVFWGMESVDPLTAYQLLHAQILAQRAISLELGCQMHQERYGPLASHAWYGSRHDDDEQFIETAVTDPTLNLDKKNEPTGQFDQALKMIERARAARGLGGATINLIYRGGTEIRTPLAWERQIIRVLEATEGQVIIDVAHGSERAHHPDFDRSVVGQLAAFDHLLELLPAVGILPRGVMVEASDAPEQPIDPNIPYQAAVERIQELDNIAVSLLKPLVTL